MMVRTALVLCFLMGGSVRAQDTRALFEKARHGIVRIGVRKPDQDPQTPPQWLGTGFLVDQQCVVATAKHIMAGVDRERLVVRLIVPNDSDEARTVPLAVLYEAPDRDLAFLRGRMPDGTTCQTGSLRALSIFAGDPKSLGGEPILMVGHPSLDEEGKQTIDFPIARAGIISSAELQVAPYGPMLLLDSASMAGFSGSPVMRVSTGEVVGVVFGPINRAELSGGFLWATQLTMQDYEKAVGTK